MATRPPSILALQDMALFVEVARAGSFTGAAKASGVPIATLSRRIAALEKRVGVRLLERTTRRLAVTEPGRRYLERCELIVQEAGLAHEALMDAAKRPAGRLRLSIKGAKDAEERADFEEARGKASAPASLGTFADLLKKR